MRAFYGIATDKRDPILIASSLNIEIPEYDGLEYIDLLVDPGDDIAETSEDSIMREDLRKLLEAAIDQLPTYNKEVIRKRFFEGQTSREVADGFGNSIQAIQNAEKKGLRRIRSGQYAQQLYEHLHPGEYYSQGLKHTSLRSYTQTGKRATEEAALKIIKLQRKANGEKDEEPELSKLVKKLHSDLLQYEKDNGIEPYFLESEELS